MPNLFKAVRGLDKLKRTRRTNAQISSSNRKEQRQRENSAALLQAFLQNNPTETATEQDDLEGDLSVEELERRFTERVVLENDSGGTGDVDSDDDDNNDGFSEEGDYNDDNGDVATQSNEETYMSKYISKIQERLKDELRSHIKDGDVEHKFSIPWQLAPSVCSKLKLPCGEPAYYCTVHVWLPEVQFGDSSMPHCGFCESNERIGRHAFDSAHPARRITGLKKDEYVMTARYICHDCKDAKRSPHTFRGCNPD